MKIEDQIDIEKLDWEYIWQKNYQKDRKKGKDWNTVSQDFGKWLENESAISESEREFEFIMLGLRTKVGISKSEFFARFGIDFDEKYGKKIEIFEKMGYLQQDVERLSLNERGFEVSNSILEEILDFDY